MADFPVPLLPTPAAITPFHAEAQGSPASVLGTAGSIAWPANNQAQYYPFTIYEHSLARQLFFWVGATSSGNIDVAIYDSALKRIVSMGTTAMSATVNTIQLVDITDTWLPPGRYLLGVACSTTGGTCFGTTANADEVALPGIAVYEQASAMPLPDPAVPVISTAASPFVAVAGIVFAAAF